MMNVIVILVQVSALIGLSVGHHFPFLRFSVNRHWNKAENGFKAREPSDNSGHKFFAIFSIISTVMFLFPIALTPIQPSVCLQYCPHFALLHFSDHIGQVHTFARSSDQIFIDSESFSVL